MVKGVRCPDCKRRYSRGKQEYNTPLVSCYIRKGKGGKEWVVVGWFCSDCKRLFNIDDKRLKEVV